MSMGRGQVRELILEEGQCYVRLSCPANLIPNPGQYVLASDGSDSPLPVPLFYTDSGPQGFIAAAPSTASWEPGHELHLRGPLGRGFSLPVGALRVGLVAFDNTPARLRGLVGHALKQHAAVVLVGDTSADTLPDEVEVQPLSALSDILEWTEYAAIDVGRENLRQLMERLRKWKPWAAQILIRTPVPCGGTAECGVCAVTLKDEWKLGCKEGPVFYWREL